MTMDDWMRRHADALARETGIDRAELELDDEAIDIVLDVAAAAAHESGARTNAPLLCYLVGRVQGERDLDELAAELRRAGS
jgi:Domain of unknown function (DUF6457)